MAELIIYGASDDCIEVEGAFEEEYQAYKLWEGLIISPDGQSLRIQAQYGLPGANTADWTLSISNTDDWPDWSIRFGEGPRGEHRDPALYLDVPEGTIIEEGYAD